MSDTRTARLKRENAAVQAEVEQLRLKLDDALVLASDVTDRLHTAQRECHDLRQRCEALKAALDARDVGLRTIEATLGTLDHSAAIDDEEALVDHVARKVSVLITSRIQYRELYLASNAIKATTEVLKLPPAPGEIKRLIRAVNALDTAISAPRKCRGCGCVLTMPAVNYAASPYCGQCCGKAHAGSNGGDASKAGETAEK